MSSSTADAPKAQKLATVSAEAAKEYAHKNYAKAAELYAQAAELQAVINGEENPQNADLLYLYGRSLYHCGLEKSDVLGTGVGSGEAAREKKRAQEGDDTTEKGKGKAKRKAGGDEELKENDKLKKAGVFSFQGDDNYDVDDDEDYEDVDDENADGEGDGEDEDDFTLAWNILDLARVFFNKRLEAATEDTETLRKVKERLADVHDILGEVSLESESFKQACVDLEESLKIKLELYPTESTLITEAHYKLSLALEFASQGGGEGDADNEVSPEDQKKGRDEAVKHMKSAIASCKKRVEVEETAIKEADGDKVGDKPKDEAEKSVEEGKDLVKELEMRLKDLMTPPQPKPAQLGEEQMAGILSSIMSGSSSDAKKMFENIISGANDISGSVRKKPKAPEAGPSSAASGSGTSNGAGAKRKAEDDTPAVEEKPVVAATGNSKKPRVTTEEEEKAAEEGTPIP